VHSGVHGVALVDDLEVLHKHLEALGLLLGGVVPVTGDEMGEGRKQKG